MSIYSFRDRTCYMNRSDGKEQLCCYCSFLYISQHTRRVLQEMSDGIHEKAAYSSPAVLSLSRTSAR